MLWYCNLLNSLIDGKAFSKKLNEVTEKIEGKKCEAHAQGFLLQASKDTNKEEVVGQWLVDSDS